MRLAECAGRYQLRRMTKHILYSAVAVSVLAASLAPSRALAQTTMNAAPSGRGTTEVSLVPADSAARASSQPLTIRIDYGQPHLRGRTLHSGNLVPYDSIWRLGANNATTLTSGVDLTLGGASIPKGSYVLQALPTRAGWKLLVLKAPAPGAAADAPPVGVARIDLRATSLQSPVESLSIWLIPSADPGAAKGELRISWGATQLSTNWSTR
jgi:hypothetical protein